MTPQSGEHYRHFKHDPLQGVNHYTYEIVGTALHTETEEPMVIYRPLYPTEYELFVRPLSMFFEHVDRDGYSGPRFVRITDAATTENRPPRIGLGVMIENEKGEVLLGKRKGSHGEGAWAFPGGKLDFGETVFACARRETKEETGLDVQDCELISVYDEFDYIETSGYQWLNIGVRATYAGGEPQCMEPEKLEEWRWFSLDALPQPLYATVPKILQNYKDKIPYREREI